MEEDILEDSDRNKLVEEIEQEFKDVLDDIQPDQLKARVIILRNNLIKLSDNLRLEVPEVEEDIELVKNEKFQKWVITNLIVNSSIEDGECIAFNKLLYYLFKKFDDNLYSLIDCYDVDFETTDNQISNINLVVKEYESW